MRKIYAFIGVIGSGKDYNSNKLLSKIEGSKKLGFSDGVRDFTFDFLGVKNVNPDSEEYSHFKEDYHLFSFGKNKNLSITGRKLMENAADKMRSYDPEFWGKEWLKKIEKVMTYTVTVITPDVRHLEELEKLINVCEKNGWEYEIKFTDFKSDRYEIREHSSEYLAQSIIKAGFSDGDDITNFCERLVKGN